MFWNKGILLTSSSFPCRSVQNPRDNGIKLCSSNGSRGFQALHMFRKVGATKLATKLVLLLVPTISSLKIANGLQFRWYSISPLRSTHFGCKATPVLIFQFYSISETIPEISLEMLLLTWCNAARSIKYCGRCFQKNGNIFGCTRTTCFTRKNVQNYFLCILSSADFFHDPSFLCRLSVMFWI